ncbi:MAG TPA: SH3 domain-containing protein, partial [Phototrophicaceae bacterium]|nr:SH3 domain-containing protein [Phototrophicaceae bacterium]
MKYALMMLICALGMIGGKVAAQDALANVAVTVQDNAALRAGPGLTWDRLAVLPYGTTYQAVGRTLDADWIQIRYDGALLPGARTDATIDGMTYGWVAAWLTVWTGNVLELPVDGVKTIAIARAAGAVIVVGPDTIMYEGSASPATRVAY